jgi:hypothetical protein
MKLVTWHGIALLVALAAMTGCTQTPIATAAASAAVPADCAHLDVDIAGAEQALNDAQERQQSAWKAVIPFAVAARHAQARSAGAQAQQQLDALRDAQRQQGCGGPAG